jgi:hypothetical protein
MQSVSRGISFSDRRDLVGRRDWQRFWFRTKRGARLFGRFRRLPPASFASLPLRTVAELHILGRFSRLFDSSRRSRHEVPLRHLTTRGAPRTASGRTASSPRGRLCVHINEAKSYCRQHLAKYWAFNAVCEQRHFFQRPRDLVARSGLATILVSDQARRTVVRAIPPAAAGVLCVVAAAHRCGTPHFRPICEIVRLLSLPARGTSSPFDHAGEPRSVGAAPGRGAKYLIACPRVCIRSLRLTLSVGSKSIEFTGEDDKGI